MCGRKKIDFCIAIQFSVSSEFFQNNRVSLLCAVWPQDWPQDFLPNPLITTGTSCLHSQLFNDFVLATGRVAPQVWTGGKKIDFWIAIQFSMNLLLWTALLTNLSGPNKLLCYNKILLHQGYKNNKRNFEHLDQENYFVITRVWNISVHYITRVHCTMNFPAIKTKMASLLNGYHIQCELKNKETRVWL